MRLLSAILQHTLDSVQHARQNDTTQHGQQTEQSQAIQLRWPTNINQSTSTSSNDSSNHQTSSNSHSNTDNQTINQSTNESVIQSINRSVILHDFTMLAVHSVILHHGGQVIDPNQPMPMANHQINHPIDRPINQPYEFLPSDWNANPLMYKLMYYFYAPNNQHINQHDSISTDEHTDNLSEQPNDQPIDQFERDTEHDPGNAEVLTSNTPIEYQLTVKATPINQFLIISMQLTHTMHTHRQDEPHQSSIASTNQSSNSPASQYINQSTEPTSVIWPPVKTTFKCSDFVDVDKLAEYMILSSERSVDQSIDHSIYHKVDQLHLVIRSLIKRCFGALYSVLIDRCDPGSHYSNPQLTDLPIDVLVDVLGSLNSLEMCRLGQTNNVLYEMTSLPMFWKVLCEREQRAPRDRSTSQSADQTTNQSINHSFNWKQEFIIRKQLFKDEQERNKYALVPVGQVVNVPIDRSINRSINRPVFRANFMDPSVNDPLGLGDWRRGGFRPVY